MSGEALSEGIFGGGDAVCGERYGLGLALGVADEAALVEAVHCVPVEGLPGADLVAVLKEVPLQVRRGELHADHVESRPDELVSVYPDVGVGGEMQVRLLLVHPVLLG